VNEITSRSILIKPAGIKARSGRQPARLFFEFERNQLSTREVILGKISGIDKVFGAFIGFKVGIFSFIVFGC